jgi:hypothetical protein
MFPTGREIYFASHFIYVLNSSNIVAHSLQAVAGLCDDISLKRMELSCHFVVYEN